MLWSIMGFNQIVQTKFIIIEVLFVPFVLTGGLSGASSWRLWIVPQHLFVLQRLSGITNTHRFWQHGLTQLILGPKCASTIFTCSIICYVQINRHLFSTWVQVHHFIILNITAATKWLLDTLSWLRPIIWLLRSHIWPILIAQSAFKCFNLSLVLAQNVIAVLVVLAFHRSLLLGF